MRRRLVYKRFRDAVQAQGMDAAAVEALSDSGVRQMAAARGMTVTFLKNMKNKLARKLRDREVETAAGWIESRVKTQFPEAQARVRRGRVIEVWLDGLPAEDVD